MVEITNKMINFIRENMLGTEEVSDCLGKYGLVPQAKSIKKGHYCVGIVQYVYGYDDSNWPIHEQIRQLEPNKILYVDAINIHDRALFGQLVSTYIFKSKNVPAIISSGLMRDISGLLEDYRYIWCAGITPIGCFHKRLELREEVLHIASKNRGYYEGSIAVCDDSGVVIISKDKITEDFYEKLVNMRKQEEIWFNCVSNRDWDTYDTVCLKKYLNE